VKSNARNRPDLLVGVVLAVSGLLIGWPVLFCGYETYLDNPVHLAEVHSLAADEGKGWSGIAYCGFPLGILHSPVWFGGMATWVRAGLPLAPLYAFLSWLGFVLPAGALYWVARKRVGPLAAGVLAYLLLIQRPAVVGILSAYGGMWPSYLAAAGIILLADRLSRPTRRTGDVAWIGLLVGGILLTHVFVSLTMLYLLMIHLVLSLLGWGAPRRVLTRDAVAVVLGVAVGAAYWLPNYLAREVFVPAGFHLDSAQLIRSLFLPVDVRHLFTGGVASGRLFFTDALPLIAVLAAGLTGTVVRFSQRGAERAADEMRPPDPLPVYGASLALVLLALLFLVVRSTDVPILGQTSWRQLYFVRVGMALAALPLLARVPVSRPRIGRGGALGLAAIVTIAGLWWGTPLRDEVADPRGREMAEVRALWEWLRVNRNPSWGRVYLQDTFRLRLNDSRLIDSHVLARTGFETGVHQLGAYYKAIPLPTSRWTGSDRGQLFEHGVRTDSDVSDLGVKLRLTNCTHMVLSVPAQADAFASVEGYRRLYRSGRYAVFELTGVTSTWCHPLAAGLRARATGYAEGDIRIAIRANQPGGSLLVKESYHPFWKTEGADPATLTAHESGLMVVGGLGAGDSELRLRWEAPAYPPWISLAGLAALLALLGTGHRRRAR
jgi:hypothetical protein